MCTYGELQALTIAGAQVDGRMQETKRRTLDCCSICRLIDIVRVLVHGIGRALLALKEVFHFPQEWTPSLNPTIFSRVTSSGYG